MKIKYPDNVIKEIILGNFAKDLTLKIIQTIRTNEMCQNDFMLKMDVKQESCVFYDDLSFDLKMVICYISYNGINLNFEYKFANENENEIILFAKKIVKIVDSLTEKELMETNDEYVN